MRLAEKFPVVGLMWMLFRQWILRITHQENKDGNKPTTSIKSVLTT
jgi:hypothetical protein